MPVPSGGAARRLAVDLVGIRYALGIAWIILIVAETLSATSGIGYLASMRGNSCKPTSWCCPSCCMPHWARWWMWPPGRWKNAGCAGIPPISRLPEENMMKLDDLQTASPIVLQGLSRRFGERVVLDALDLHIPQGQFLAIVGRSGCGKSTLLRLLAGLDQADGGLLQQPAGQSVPGDVPGSPPAAMEKRAGQCGAGFAGHRRGEAEQALAEVGLADRAQEWPAPVVRRSASAGGPGAGAGASALAAVAGRTLGRWMR
jgi:hypothetical protein